MIKTIPKCIKSSLKIIGKWAVGTVCTVAGEGVNQSGYDKLWQRCICLSQMSLVKVYKTTSWKMKQVSAVILISRWPWFQSTKFPPTPVAFFLSFFSECTYPFSTYCLPSVHQTYIWSSEVVCSTPKTVVLLFTKQTWSTSSSFLFLCTLRKKPKYFKFWHSGKMDFCDESRRGC